MRTSTHEMTRSTYLDHVQHRRETAGTSLQARHRDIARDTFEHVEGLLEGTDGGVGGILSLAAP